MGVAAVLISVTLVVMFVLVVGVDLASSLVTIFGLPIALVGVSMVYYQLRASHRAQRLQSDPYVRVDLAPVESWRLPDLQMPAPYYRSAHAVIELRAGVESVSFCAWFRNLQTSPLGTAYGIRSALVLEVLSAAEGDFALEPVQADVEIPYLETGKPVCLEVFRVPVDWDVAIHIVSLVYANLHDRDVRSNWVSGPEAWHGRLTCRYVGGVCRADPIYEPPDAGRLWRIWLRVKSAAWWRPDGEEDNA